MSEVDFSDQESATAWFEAQSDEKRCAMASRAALRMVANIGRVDDPSRHRLALSVLRAIITSAACGVGHTAEVRTMLHSAARSATFSARSSDSAALSAIPSSIRSAALSADSAARSAAASADSAFSARAAAFSARSAAFSAHSARSAAFSATQTDAAFDPEALVRSAVWSGTPVPDAIFLAHGVFMQSLYSHPDWAFWAQWYRGMWDGTFRNWELATEVALIPDEVWEGEDAVGKVAEAIRGIEAERAEKFDRPDNVPELQRQKLLDHVQRLLAAPDMTALAAEGAADTLERAIAQYLKEAPANCLPDALQHLEGVPPLFRRIATTVKGTERADAKEAKLATVVEALNAKIARLEADLHDARAKTVHGLFTQNALKAAGTTFGAGLVGSLGLAVSHFFGEWPSDITLENLRGWLSDVSTAEPKTAEPKSEAQTLPSDIEV
ncbi:hypothetical protein [Tateyamaria sp. SN3-11]|uniref:hypothetical protein n=1 Tax=Tateyamaria sp. SN3-11 TaxID=3092147 RepID=UPI0039EB8381